MKRNSMLIVASTLLVMASSCSLEITPTLSENEKNVKTVDITIVANDKPAVEAEVATKTYIDGTAIKWSNSGEKLKVWEVATPAEGELVTSSNVSSDGVTKDSGSTMSFAVSMDDKSTGYTNFDYYAVYPSSSYQTGSAVTGIALNTTAAQTPSSTNFDPSHDLLIAKKVVNGESQASGLSMQFARVVAIGKMNVKNLGSSEDITKITFSAKIGDTPVALAGRTTFDLNTAKPTTEYGSNTKDYSIILNYEGQNIQANTAEGMVAYFTCYPFAINSETPGSFKVVVETATKTFTKEVSVSSAKGLAFNIGKASVFSVDMDGIEGQDKAVDLCYAYLVPTDVSLAASYGNASITKPHGDKWSMYARLESGNIGVRRNDNGNNDSYIKLPDFVNDIKTVVVTLNSPASEKTITLENSATATTGTIAQLATTGATVYTFDLTSGPSVKTAYFRSSGAQAKVEKIEVYSGTDSRVRLTTPPSVTAVRNTDDDDITNKIDVSWGAVSGAVGYEVTLTPTEGDVIVRSTASTSVTIGDLEYSTSYTPSVVAIADPYLNLNSLAGTGSAATTEAATTFLFLNSSMLTSVEANSYGTLQSFVAGGYTWRHTGYRLDLSGYIQLTSPATRYIELPLVPGTIKKIVFSVTNSNASSEGDTGNKCKNNLTFSCLDYSISSDIDTANGVNEITLIPSSSTFRNGFITASGSLRIWDIKIFYSSDEAILSSITITTPATKTTYAKDEAIVFDGKVQGNYSNSSIADVSHLVEVTGDTSSAGDTDVTVSYGGKTTTYPITVNSEAPKVYSLTFTSISNNCQNYTSTWDQTCGGFTWTLSNFNNNKGDWTGDGIVKCGNKTSASVCDIITKSKISEAIETVSINISAITASKINSIKLYISDNKSSWTEVDTFESKTGSQSITIDSPAASKYYKISFDCQKGSSNGLVSLLSATFSE